MIATVVFDKILSEVRVVRRSVANGSASGDLQTDRTFTGQKIDASGLLYYNARYYDPNLGTFISPGFDCS